MKKKTKILSLILCLSLFVGVSAQAAEIPIYSEVTGEPQYTIGSSDFKVKFNGEIVSFPDAQPYVDEDSRTLVPLRFVTQKMGATVTWDEKTRTATVEKDGTSVIVEIESENLNVTKNGETVTIKMDTRAVLKDGRTFVPVRYVAQTLGAWVGYSDLYSTAQIYDDVLTPDEIDRLHGYEDLDFEAYRALKNEKTYGDTNESWTKRNPQIAHFTGSSDYGFSNANEWALNKPKGSFSEDVTSYKAESYLGVLTKKPFKLGVQEPMDFAKIAVEEAVLGTQLQLKDLGASLKTDLSCVAASRHFADGTLMVRGILTMDIPEDANLSRLSEKFGMEGIKAGGHYECDVELKLVATAGKLGAVGMRSLGGVK